MNSFIKIMVSRYIIYKFSAGSLHLAHPTQTYLYTNCYRRIKRYISFFITPIILSSLIACGGDSAATATPAPAAANPGPAGVAVVILSDFTSLRITWDNVPQTTRYEVYDSSGAKIATITPPSNSYTATDLLPNTKYTYGIQACSSSGCSDSAEVSFTTEPIGVSSAPQVTVVASTIGNAVLSLRVSWDIISEVTSYQIFNRTGEVVATVPAPSTNHIIAQRSPGTLYEYKVRGCYTSSVSGSSRNSMVCGGLSPAGSITTPAVTSVVIPVTPDDGDDTTITNGNKVVAISISNATGLAAIRTNSTTLAGNYTLTGNIDLSSIPNWQPIGNTTNRFTGIFNGNGYEISGINISGYPHAGLFGYVENANIRNIGVLVGNISSSLISYSGGLVGLARSSYISNSYAVVEGGISSSYSGGLVGYAGRGRISNSHAIVEGSILSSLSAGGLVGYINESPINASYAVVEGNILSSTSRPDVSTFAGGLVGLADESSISNSYVLVADSISSLSSEFFSFSGGLVGLAAENLIINSYAVVAGSISSSSSAGGLIGEADNSDISSSYYNGSRKSSEGEFSNSHGTSETLSGLRRLTADATTWDTGIWNFGAATNLPMLVDNPLTVTLPPAFRE